MPGTTEFDALIDLLASDGIEDDAFPTQAPPALRNHEGKLDYTRIRSFFSTKHLDATEVDPGDMDMRSADDSGLDRTPRSVSREALSEHVDDTVTGFLTLVRVNTEALQRFQGFLLE